MFQYCESKWFLYHLSQTSVQISTFNKQSPIKSKKRRSATKLLIAFTMTLIAFLALLTTMSVAFVVLNSPSWSVSSIPIIPYDIPSWSAWSIECSTFALQPFAELDFENRLLLDFRSTCRFGYKASTSRKVSSMSLVSQHGVLLPLYGRFVFHAAVFRSAVSCQSAVFFSFWFLIGIMIWFEE